jgi:hypothetical protein
MAEPQQYQFKELEKFQLYTETPGVSGKRSRLTFSSYRGNPRITVFTNVPNDTGKGVLYAAMNPETFLIFLDLMEKLAREPKEDKFKIDCSTILKAAEGEERSNEKTLLSELYCGRDANGVIWISVISPNRPKIKFEYKVSDFHKIYHGDGRPFTEQELSSVQAMATIRALREVMIAHMGEIKPPYVPGSNGNQAKSAPAAASKVSTSGFDDISF